MVMLVYQMVVVDLRHSLELGPDTAQGTPAWNAQGFVALAGWRLSNWVWVRYVFPISQIFVWIGILLLDYCHPQ